MSNLTPAQLHCIALHIQEHVKKEMHGESGFPNACTNCPKRQPEIHCHWDAFSALSEATGVDISPRVIGELGNKTLNQLRQERGLEPIEDERGREKIVYSSSPIEISHESVIDSARLLKDININLAEALGSGEHEKDLMIIHEIRENCKMIKLLLEHRICPISQEKKGIFSKKGKSKGGYCAYGPPNEL